jgi:dephospho-CoA kinase
MLKIGITGGIGTGKTTICKVFEVLGIPVFYADTVAKQLMHTDQLLIQDIKEVFGTEAYSENGELDRKYLASIVFNNEEHLNKLNSLVHPAVFRAHDAWINEHLQAPYVLKEAALLFESGSYKMSDYNILVISPLDLRIKRVIKRDGISEAEVKSRIDKQLSDEEKEKLTDFMLQNDESQLLIPQVLTLHQNFLKLRS